MLVIKSLGREDVFFFVIMFGQIVPSVRSNFYQLNNLARKTTRSVCYFDKVIQRHITLKE